jgi:2-oxoglutarate ferredoxin oxidoreductase subunit beta
LRHNGFALIVVLSPCVSFNDEEGSTKSYTYTREHYHAAVETDFVPPAQEIAVDYAAGESMPVSLHDGSQVILRKLDPSYDPTDRTAAYNYIGNKLKKNEYVTGLIHIDESDSTEFHNLNHTAEAPLNSIPFEKLSPGRAALDKLMSRYR